MTRRWLLLGRYFRQIVARGRVFDVGRGGRGRRLDGAQRLGS